MHKSIQEYVILWKMYTQAPIISPLFSLLRDRSEMKMKSNCAVFSRQLLHHGNQPNDPAVLVEQFFMDNKKDLTYLISNEDKRNLIDVIVGGVNMLHTQKFQDFIKI